MTAGTPGSEVAKNFLVRSNILTCVYPLTGWSCFNCGRAERVTLPTQDIVVFDEESDRHVIIPWEDAIGASYCTKKQNSENNMSGVYYKTILSHGAGLDTTMAKEYITKTVPNVQTAAASVAASASAGTTPDAAAQEIVDAIAAAQFPGDTSPGSSVSHNLTAGEWRDLANCWRLIAKYGVNKDWEAAGGNAGPGNFPILETEAASFSISTRFRGKKMQDFMEIPEFRVYCVVARPFIEHIMQSAVMTVAGRDTGAMLFGPSDMCAKKNLPLVALLLF
jgi:hypothetical protein